MALNTRLGRPAGTKATLNPSTWLREETVAGFSDFIQQKRPHKGGKAKEPEKSSFNINEMCEYTHGRVYTRGRTLSILAA
jgi:hypothetical protein